MDGITPPSESNIGERRFPNEILALVIANLCDDLPSLRETALVCKDFASLSQPYIFREIKLTDIRGKFRAGGYSFITYYPLVHRLAMFLRDPRTMFLNRFVIKLRFSTWKVSPLEVEDTVFILWNLPSLAELTIYSPQLVHYPAVEMSCSSYLKALHIDDMILHSQEDFDIFQRMLMSLTVLQKFALRFWSAGRLAANPKQAVLILPTSLIQMSFTGIDDTALRAIALGLQESHPLALKAFFLNYWVDNLKDCSILWREIRAETQIILDVGYGSDSDEVHSFTPAFIACTKGLLTSHIMLVAKQEEFLALLLAWFIPNLSDSVHSICIDIDASRHGTTTLKPVPHLDRRDQWEQLDSALVKRHSLGILKHICFRCTIRKESFIYSVSFEMHPSGMLDRTILGHIDELLPRSKAGGFLKVDWTTKYFKPTM